jgi:hypothetical protein
MLPKNLIARYPVQNLQRAGFRRPTPAKAMRTTLAMEMLQQKMEEEKERSPQHESQKCSTFRMRAGWLLI